MKNYEGLFIIKPDVSEADLTTILKSITDLLAKHKAQLTKEENWGKRPLSYPVRKCREGVYYKVNFESSPDEISRLKESYALQPEILRVMFTKR